MNCVVAGGSTMVHQLSEHIDHKRQAQKSRSESGLFASDGVRNLSDKPGGF